MAAVDRPAASSISETPCAALSSPSRTRPIAGDFRVFNQFTEQFSVGELAELVKAAAQHLGYVVEIEHRENPRVELEEHYYNAVHTKLIDLGLEPTLLGEELVESMIHLIERYKKRVIASSIDPHTRWNPAKSPAGQA